jgi:prevent-host-death family protein
MNIKQHLGATRSRGALHRPVACAIVEMDFTPPRVGIALDMGHGSGMSMTVDIRELADRFAELIAQTKEGGEVIVTDQGIPRARLLPLTPPKPRLAGLHAGSIQAGPDFDGALPDDFWAGQP